MKNFVLKTGETISFTNPVFVGMASHHSVDKKGFSMLISMSSSTWFVILNNQAFDDGSSKWGIEIFSIDIHARDGSSVSAIDDFDTHHQFIINAVEEIITKVGGIESFLEENI